MLDTVLGPWDTSVNKGEKDSCHQESGRRETSDKHKLYDMLEDD